MLYTGLDSHRSFSYITTMNDKGEIVGQKKLSSNGEVVDFLKGLGRGWKWRLKLHPAGTGFMTV